MRVDTPQPKLPQKHASHVIVMKVWFHDGRKLFNPAPLLHL